MKRASFILIALVLALFLAGLYRLLDLRFSTGDVYPPYSSFRADPLGSKAWFESLHQLRLAQRHLRPLAKLPPAQESTLFFLGARPRHLKLAPAEWESLQGWIRQGGRLVIAFLPTRDEHFGTSPFSTPPVAAEDQRTDLLQALGMSLDFDPLEASEEVGSGREAYLEVGAESLPQRLPIRTALYFGPKEAAWRILYRAAPDHPVLVDRSLGEGKVVLVADAYPLSNEALLVERESRLLAWLAGASHRFVFEETHLGVESRPGIATLVRKYDLHALVLTLLVLAGLYVWQQAVPFLPRLPANGNGAVTVTGRDASEGLVNLLRRGVPQSELLALCLDRWREQVQPSRRIEAERLRQMQDLIDTENRKAPRERNPVELYNRLARILDRRPQPHTPPSSS